MLVQAGFAGALDGDEAALDALTRARVISGNEETVRGRLQELLTSGLDELLLQLVPIADAGEERRRLLQLVGSL
jgi:alkanesulfonate monooxygenase SsuD/methylene tetrahydromethanopterin reductase-like flavin-dependent oxidoreductase (luciferase family)